MIHAKKIVTCHKKYRILELHSYFGWEWTKKWRWYATEMYPGDHCLAEFYSLQDAKKELKDLYHECEWLHV